MMRWLGDKWDKMLLLMFAATALFAFVERRISASLLLGAVLIYFYYEMVGGGATPWRENWERSQENIKRNLKYGARRKRSGRPR